MAKKLKIKLKKSMIGRTERIRRTLRAMGLMKINQVVELSDNPAVRGMVNKVIHMVEVEELK